MKYLLWLTVAWFLTLPGEGVLAKGGSQPAGKASGSQDHCRRGWELGPGLGPSQGSGSRVQGPQRPEAFALGASHSPAPRGDAWLPPTAQRACSFCFNELGNIVLPPLKRLLWNGFHSRPPLNGGMSPASKRGCKMKRCTFAGVAHYKMRPRRKFTAATLAALRDFNHPSSKLPHL